MRRNLVNFGCEVRALAKDQQKDTHDLLSHLGSKLFKISAATSNKSMPPLSSMVLELKKHAEEGMAMAREGVCGGVSTGFSQLDTLTDGLHENEMVVIGGRPGMGKTAMLVQILKNVASDGVPAAIFTLEETTRDLLHRMISAVEKIPLSKIRGGSLSGLEKYNKTMDAIAKLRVFIDDTSPLSLSEFSRKCRRMVKKECVRVVFIDNLHSMTSEKCFNREQEIGKIVRGLKNIAKELKITIVVTSSLSRSVETRGGDKRPYLSDLRDSGTIECIADIVGFIYRPECYGITLDEEGRNTRGLSRIAHS